MMLAPGVNHTDAVLGGERIAILHSFAIVLVDCKCTFCFVHVASGLWCTRGWGACRGGLQVGGSITRFDGWVHGIA